MALLNLFRPQQLKLCRQVPVTDLNGLHTILAHDVNLAYWQRQKDNDIEFFLQQCMEAGFKTVDQNITGGSVAVVVESAFASPNNSDTGRQKLIADIVQLTHTFLRIANSHQARLHLRVVNNDAYARFHTDAYPLRLLCSYTGGGTEWVADADVNRSQIWLGTNDEIVPDRNSIKRLAPFDVALLKGDPGFKSNAGIVHRSPPIEALGEKRFVLRIDVNE